jgi:hypothetical protein
MIFGNVPFAAGECKEASKNADGRDRQQASNSRRTGLNPKEAHQCGGNGVIMLSTFIYSGVLLMIIGINQEQFLADKSTEG